MRDSEYILDEVIRLLKVNLEVVENRLITGNIHNIEDYKYNLGLRSSLSVVQDYINDLIKAE